MFLLGLLVGTLFGVFTGSTIYKFLERSVTPIPSSDFEWSDQFNEQNEWNVWYAASCADYIKFELSLEDTKPHFIKESEE